ncbi:MAG: hypothetical protein R3F34_16165 [Planctomycetota bacterium]
MQIHRVTGKGLRDALERAAKLHGSSALVLAQEKSEDGDVVVSVLPRAESAVERFARFGFAGDDERDRLAERTERDRDPALFDLRQRLRRSGCSKAFTDAVAARADALRAKGLHPIDGAAAVIGRSVPIAEGPRSHGRSATIGLVGPEPELIRTTAIALGRKLTLAGRRTALVSFEPHPTPEGDALEDEALAAGLHVLRGDDGARIGGRLVEDGDFDVVLVCTTGRTSFDGRQLLRLGGSLRDADRLGSISNYLVVPAQRQRSALDQAWRTCARFKPKGIVAAACDRTREYGPVCELARERACGLVFLAGRSADPAQLVRPTKRLVADLLLGGTLPWN